MPRTPEDAGPVLLFDGVCVLCNRAVQFVLRHDSRAGFRFAPLQTAVAQRLLARCGAGTPTLDSVLLVADGRVFVKSRAVLEVLRRLDAPWPMLYALVVVPRPLADALYDVVVCRRYRWFGTMDRCMAIPGRARAARLIRVRQVARGARPDADPLSSRSMVPTWTGAEPPRHGAVRAALLAWAAFASAAAWPMPRLAILEPGASPQESLCHVGFQEGLQGAGHVDGRNVAVVTRFASGDPARLPALAAELVAARPNVIWVHSIAAARAAREATASIPIVVGVAVDLVASGFAASESRPGGNLTGLENRDVELLGRRLQLLKQLVPSLTRAAVLLNPRVPAHVANFARVEREAATLGVRLLRVDASGPADFAPAFARIAAWRADALIVTDSTEFSRNRAALLQRANAQKLPTMSGDRHWAESGALASYGADVRELCRRSAHFVDRVLKGASPAEMPIERAQRFDFVVNLAVARSLGLTVPDAVLALATGVIR